MRRAGKRAGATAGRAMDAVRDALARSPTMVAFISLLTAAAAASVAPSRPAVGSGPLTLEPSPRLGVRQISERSDLSLLRLRGGEQQSTYAMLKPDIAGDAATVEAVKEMIAAAGLTLEREEACQLSAEECEAFYAEHAERPFFAALVAFVSGGQVLKMELSGDDAIAKWRALIGPTDSNKAREEAPDSVRAKFGTDNQRNAAHGSDSTESAARELAMMFA